jgi:hypothetical protein
MPPPPPLAEQLEPAAGLPERNGVRVERHRVEPTRGHRVGCGADARDVDLRVALVGVHHVEPAPVPELQDQRQANGCRRRAHGR